MDRYWIGFQWGNVAFWTHEWNRHGDYSAFNLTDYFDKTCDLFLSLSAIYPIDAVLSRNGLIYISFAFLFLNSCVFLINIKIAVFFFFLLFVTGITPGSMYTLNTLRVRF
jgi:hypothetical protein